MGEDPFKEAINNLLWKHEVYLVYQIPESKRDRDEAIKVLVDMYSELQKKLHDVRPAS